MLYRALPVLFLCLPCPAIAHAEPAERGPANSGALDHTHAPANAPAGEEVDVAEAVRSARRELLALLARDAATLSPGSEDTSAANASDSPPRVGTLPEAPLVTLGPPPPSMTSAVPVAPRSATGPNPELGWLRGLSLPDLPVRWDDRLVRMLEYYKNDSRGRAQIRGLLARQGSYGALIRTKLRAANLPEDLVYLAMVESAYDPRARSEAGALGIWQLMAAPANEYDLEMSRWVDERMCPEHSTDAALHYLHDVYADLGSWPLSIAAFNMGYGALLRAIQKYNTNDYWLLSSMEAGLPYETITYVTRVMAFAIIGHNRARFGVADVNAEAPIESVSIEIAGGTSLTKVARAAGVEVATLSALNPELKKTRLPPDVKTWPVRIPRDRAQRFREKWHHLGLLLPAHREHVLRLGERLSDLADMYGTTPAKLLKLNDMTDASGLQPGQKLIVPDVDPAPKLQSEHPVVGVPSESFVYVDRRRIFYRVADGDEIAEIAHFFHVTTDEIRMWNRVSVEAKLQRGMFLQLFVPADAELARTVVLAPNQVRTLVVGSEEFFNFQESQQNRVRVRYRVKPGDTLRSVAEHFELSVGSIARINQFARDKKLEPDSEIIVYMPDQSKRNATN